MVTVFRCDLKGRVAGDKVVSFVKIAQVALSKTIQLEIIRPAYSLSLNQYQSDEVTFNKPIIVKMIV